MHDAMRIMAWAWLAFVVVLVLYGAGASVLGSAERRQATRRTIVKTINDGGWIYLSLTLKTAGSIFPHIGNRAPWLWIVPLAIAAATWSIKGALALMRRRKRMRAAETTYTRSLRRTSRRKR